MDATESWVKEREKQLLDQSAGGAALADAEWRATEAEAKEIKARTAKMMEDSGIAQRGPSPDDYDYENEVRRGNNFQPPQPGGDIAFSNQSFRPYAVTVGGRDLRTNEQVFDKYEDLDGQISAGVSELQKSSFSLDRGRPGTDAPALAKIANAIARQGGTFDDFRREASAGWDDETLLASWNGNQYARFRESALQQLQEAARLAEEEGELPVPDVDQDWGKPLEWKPGEELEPVDPDRLSGNREYLQATAVMYEWFEQKKFEGNSKDLVKWGLTQMGLFNWNVAYQALFTTRALTAASDAQKWAIYKSMQYYDALESSPGGFMRAAMGIATDPTTYFTFGFGKLGTKAAGVVAKNAVTRALMQGLRGRVIGAATGAGASAAGWNTLDGLMRQTLEKEAGARDSYDWGDLSVRAGLGLGLGATMAGTATTAFSKEFVEMASRLRNKGSAVWADLSDQFQRLAASEAGYIEIRANKAKATEAIAKRAAKQTPEEKARIVTQGVKIQDNMAEPSDWAKAQLALHEMDRMDDMPDISHYRDMLEVKRDAHGFHWTRWVKKKNKTKESVMVNTLYPDEINKFIAEYKGSKLGQTCMQVNGKTGLSIDFSTDCPRRRCGKGACLYCYVESARTTHTNAKNITENPYRGEVMDWPDSMIAELNRDGGIRMFSFGDFRPDIDDDNVTRLLADAKKRGLYIKAITKEPELIKRFASHPNLRVNLSIDSMPRAISNTLTPDEARKLADQYPGKVKIRSVALNKDEALKHLEDPRIDVVTLYHGLKGEKLLEVVRAQNPKVFEMMDPEELTKYMMSWESIGAPNSSFKKWAIKNYPGKVCCEGGKCARDKTKCGWGLGMLIPGVHLPDNVPDYEGDGEE